MPVETTMKVISVIKRPVIPPRLVMSKVRKVEAANGDLKPPLKWAGGKRWQVPHLRALWADHKHRRLVEPVLRRTRSHGRTRRSIRLLDAGAGVGSLSLAASFDRLTILAWGKHRKD